MALHGQVVMERQKFQLLDGDELEYPGDSEGKPGNVIHCYCVMIPRVLLPEEELAPRRLYEGEDDGDGEDETRHKLSSEQPVPDWGKIEFEQNPKEAEFEKDRLRSILGLDDEHISIDGICNGKALNVFNNAMAECVEKMNVVIARINTADKIYGDPSCIAMYDDNSKTLTLSSKFFSAKKETENVLKVWVENGIIPKGCANVKYIAYHEATHSALWNVNDKSGLARVYSSYVSYCKSGKKFSKNALQNKDEFAADVNASNMIAKKQNENWFKRTVQWLNENGVNKQ